MPTKVIAGATHIGYRHLDSRSNNQDAFIIGTTLNGYHYGFCSDGCGSGKHNETSSLLVFFLANKTEELLEKHDISEIPDLLWEEILKYYRSLAKIHGISLNSKAKAKEAEAFVSNYLRHTVLGFISNETTTIIFTRGDGFFCVNEKIIKIERDNAPDYPGYLLVPWSVPSDYLKPGFEVITLKSEELKHIFISTDGVNKSLVSAILDEMSEIEDSVDLRMLLNRQFDFGTPFSDDATVVLLNFKE